MNISEFQFRFLDIAEQIECTSKHSPLNLKETLNYVKYGQVKAVYQLFS